MSDSSLGLVVFILLINILQPNPIYLVKEKYDRFIREHKDRKWKREHYYKKRPYKLKPTVLSKCKLRPTYITQIPERCVIKRKD